MSHPRHQLDDLIHTSVRFSLMAALHAADRIAFPELRDLLEVSDSLLSKHMLVLEREGYIEVVKGSVGRRPRTWLQITDRGAAAFENHLRALRDIVGGAAVPVPTPEQPTGDPSPVGRIDEGRSS